MKRIIRVYCEQLCANRLDYLDKSDKFLKRHKLLKLTQEIENWNRPIISKEIELVI